MNTLLSGARDLLSRDLPPALVARIAVDPKAQDPRLVEYRSSGSAEAPAIVLLHGIGSSSAGYRAQLAGLAQSFRVIAWNAPGFGRSTLLKKDQPTVQDYVEALDAFLRALGVDCAAALVGSSWGSVIAVAFARAYPERVGRLVLSAPNVARGGTAIEARASAIANMLGAGRADSPEERRAVADRLLPADAPQEVRHLVERLRDAVTADGWTHAVHMLFSVHTPELIAGVRSPVDIVVGTHDTVAPKELHALPLLEAAAQGSLHLLDGVGHMPKLEVPVRFNDIVAAAASGR
jgi:pimeloyl-ACP methyl ester carboxylesterase